MPDDVPEDEKTRRIVALQALQKRDPGRSCIEAAVGRVEPVLVDSRSRRRDWELSGRTSGNTVVNFTGDADVDRHARAGADHRRESEQPAGRESCCAGALARLDDRAAGASRVAGSEDRDAD